MCAIHGNVEACRFLLLQQAEFKIHFMERFNSFAFVGMAYITIVDVLMEVLMLKYVYRLEEQHKV